MDYSNDDAAVRRAYGDQASARIRDVGVELVRAADKADITAVSGDFILDGLGHVRLIYDRTDDEMWLGFPTTEREPLQLSIERLGIRR